MTISNRLARSTSAAIMFFSMAFSQAAFAKTTITIDDDLAISFESGQLDTRTYQGEIFQAEILENDRIIAIADRILMVTSGTYEQPDFVLERLEIDNLESSDDGLSLNAKSIRIGNFPLGWLSDDLESSPNIDWNNTSYQMEFVEFINDVDGVAAFIPKLATMPLKFDTLPDGTSYMASGGIEMPYMQILPTGDSQFADEFQAWLNEAGLPHIELSIFARGTNEPNGSDMVSDSLVELRMLGLFDLLFSSEFHMSTEAFGIISNPNIADVDDDAYLGLLASEGRLGALEISMRDQGLLDFIDSTGALPPLASLGSQLQLIGNSFLPETGDDLTTPIAEFLSDGGALQITANPDSPFKVEDLAAAIFMADFVVQQLNLETSRQP